jgi:trehalose 6-phosphate phosphatase
VPTVLTALVDLVGTVAIITGRPVAQALALAGIGEDDHGIVVLGQYGAQRWDADAGEVTSAPPPAGLPAVIEKLPDVLAALGAPAEVGIEDKGIAVAVHTRQVSEPGVWVERLRGPLVALATRHDLVVERGRFVLELRAPGRDKGSALLGLVSERSSTSVLFAGDDLGDLAAYDAVDALRADGVPGVLVCSGSTEVTELAERADLVVDGPVEVVGLLETLVETL